MGPLDVVWHLGNLLWLPLALGAVAAAAAKLLWRHELAAVAWKRLALPAALASTVVVIAGLVVFGRDGKMATYVFMVSVCAFTLWWQGFGPGRR